jgi:predicted DNA-binding transcriptional regulator YafY
VLHDRRIKVLYRRWEAPREVERTLDPYGLVLKNGSWYVVASASGAVRTYRVSNILDLTVTDEEFTRPPGFDLATVWREHLEEFDQRRFTGTAVVRVSARLVNRRKDVSFPLLVKAIEAAEPAEDGTVTVTVPIESVGNAAAQFIRYGDELEVLAPDEVRAEIRRLATTVAALYPAP